MAMGGYIKIGNAAVQVAQSVSYENAGTIEFLIVKIRVSSTL